MWWCLVISGDGLCQNPIVTIWKESQSQRFPKAPFRGVFGFFSTENRHRKTTEIDRLNWVLPPGNDPTKPLEDHPPSPTLSLILPHRISSNRDPNAMYLCPKLWGHRPAWIVQCSGRGQVQVLLFKNVDRSKNEYIYIYYINNIQYIYIVCCKYVCLCVNYIVLIYAYTFSSILLDSPQGKSLTKQKNIAVCRGELLGFSEDSPLVNHK